METISYKVKQKNISEIEDRELIDLYNRLLDHEEWLWYIKEEYKQTIPTMVEEMMLCFMQYIKEVETTGYEENTDKETFNIAYNVVSEMFKVIDEYCMGKSNMSTVEKVWNDKYSPFLVELSRRCEKLKLRASSKSEYFSICSKFRKYKAYLEENEYSDHSCSYVLSMYIEEFLNGDCSELEEIIDVYENEINEYKNNKEKAKSEMKKFLELSEKESYEMILNKKKQNSNKLNSDDFWIFSKVFV